MNPAAVALAITDAWEQPPPAEDSKTSWEALPDRAVLESFLKTSFEASLLREEKRPLNFRLILRGPEKFPQFAGPPEGLHRLLFSRPRPFTLPELRRLTPAVDYDRSLVGVCLDKSSGHLQIWGIIHSGPRWLEQFHGGRGNATELPDSLIVGVSAPGYLTISQGSRPISVIESGTLQTNRLNVFRSKWLPESFAHIREELMRLHAAERAKSDLSWATIDVGLTRMVAQQMIQRVISTVQRSWHGGTLLIVPPNRADVLVRPNNWVNLKYTFKDEEPRARFRSLIIQVMKLLATTGMDSTGGNSTVGWEDYGRLRSPELTSLDEAIFEMSHLIATLTQVDGAVVITKRFELLGFGGEIAGTLPEVDQVAHALDLEGETYKLESTDDVGMRHRSVYRLCNALHDVLGIVVSQDGGAAFIRWNDSRLTYWPHTTIASS